MSLQEPFVPVSSEPVFTVLGMESVPGSLTPTLRFELHVAEPEGDEVHTIALTTHIHVEPARRAYDAAATPPGAAITLDRGVIETRIAFALGLAREQGLVTSDLDVPAMLAA